MASLDLGPFAQLTPMAVSFEAAVRIDTLWRTVFEQLETFDSRREAIKSLTGIDEGANWPRDRLAELIGRATAVALQDCIEQEVVSLYILNPQSNRFHRLPKNALVSEFVSVTRIAGQDTSVRAARTSETSWANGTLFEIDCDKSLYRLAREALPLMTSDAEAAATLEGFRRILEQEAGGSSRPTAVASIDHRRWVADLFDRPRWPTREALLWIALRSPEEMADLVQSSIWKEQDEAWGMSGAIWVAGHIEAQRDDRTFVEEAPERALIRELTNDTIRATGLFEGRGQRQEISGYLWEDLRLASSPTPQRDGSAACRKDQIHGIAWTGHWTGILFDRRDLITVFPQIALDGGAQPSAAQRSRCRAWLADEMRRSADRRPMSKARYLMEARSVVGESLPKRSFNAAWTAAIQETGATAWERPGRPSKSTR